MRNLEQLSTFTEVDPVLRLLERSVLSGGELPVGTIRANDHSMTRDLVMHGADIGLLPCGLMKHDVDNGLVRQVLEATTLGVTGLSMEFPSGADILPRVRAFASHLEEALHGFRPRW